MDEGFRAVAPFVQFSPPELRWTLKEAGPVEGSGGGEVALNGPARQTIYPADSGSCARPGSRSARHPEARRFPDSPDLMPSSQCLVVAIEVRRHPRAIQSPNRDQPRHSLSRRIPVRESRTNQLAV